MELVLWRHAEAEDGLPDEERKLTARGERQAERMAVFLRTRLPEDTRILVSPALRAQQTVQPLSEHFEVVPALGAGALPQDVLDAVGWPEQGDSVLVVGHQPYLGQIAALLLANMDSSLSIKKGAVWWLSRSEREGDYQTNLRLVMSPEFL